MLKYYIYKPLAYVTLGFLCMSFYPGYNNSSSTSTPPGIRPGVSDDSVNYQQQPGRQASEREKIAYVDYRDTDIHQRANRMGDWDNNQNWRYDRQAFYQGETQPEAYRREHPYGTPGIGYNTDQYYNSYPQNNVNYSSLPPNSPNIFHWEGPLDYNTGDTRQIGIRE